MARNRQMLPGFHRQLAGEALSPLAGLVGCWIPAPWRARLRGSGVRKRVFTAMTTFWNFLSQVLSPAQSCRETVRQVQAARYRRRKPAIAAGTGAYCQARAKLPARLLQELWQSIASQLAGAATPAMRWRNLRVAVVDGTTLSMPDTPANQAAWPQSSNQKRGCGFPIMKLVGLFSLSTGAVCALACGTLHHAEHALFVKLWRALTGHFDLLLGDRNFGSFATFCALQRAGLHGVFRLHQARKIDWRRGQRLGKHDRVVRWKKPPKLSWWLPLPIPESIPVRVIRVCVAIPGFRTHVTFLSTSLLDPKRFPAEALADLYRRRWGVELFFRHIKTAMHMDVLRCRSPRMIRREVHMHLIAYNLIRALMLQAALAQAADLSRVSFKGTCDSLRQWAPHLACVAAQPALYRKMFRALIRIVAQDRVPHRPDRSEPRAVKRRPKNYHRLTKPRHLMGNLPHRNRP
jgi:hypothetical protein